MLPSSSPPPTRRLVEVEAMATVLSAARLLRSLLSTRRLAEVVATGTASLLEFLAIQRTVTFNVSTTCALVFVLLHLLTSLTLGHIILTATPVSSSSLPPARAFHDSSQARKAAARSGSASVEDADAAPQGSSGSYMPRRATRSRYCTSWDCAMIVLSARQAWRQAWMLCAFSWHRRVRMRSRSSVGRLSKCSGMVVTGSRIDRSINRVVMIRRLGPSDGL